MNKHKQDKGILFLGNHFGKSKVWEQLPQKLSKINYLVITASRIKCKLFRILDMIFTMLFRSKQYDIVAIDVFSGQAFWFAEIGTFLARVNKKKLILNLRGGDLPNYAKNHPHRVERVLRSAQKVISPSPYLSEQLSHLRGDIQVIPNPIAVKDYLFRERNSVQPTLIWLRAFHKIYNPNLTPQFMKLLVDKFPEAKLYMIGPDKGDGSFEETRQLAHDFGLDTHIDFVGEVERDAVPQWLDKADIFINTTDYDNTPVSVIEAMVSGLCVVSTNVGGLPYLLAHDVDALLVSRDDPQAMAKAVERFLSDPGLASKLSTNAHKKAEQFDWSVVLPQWKKLFSEVNHED